MFFLHPCLGKWTTTQYVTPIIRNNGNSIIWCHSYEGVRQCGPKDHLGGVFLVPPSEIRQASGHLPSCWERSWDGGMSSRQSCSQEKSSAGFEQDEEVTNILLLIPNSQSKDGMSVLSWMITRSPSLNNNSQPVAESNGGLQVFFAHWQKKVFTATIITIPFVSSDTGSLRYRVPFVTHWYHDAFYVTQMSL